MKKKILLIVAAAFMLNSCDDLFEPAKENFKDVEQMHDDAAYAQGFLLRAYGNIPGYYNNSEYATDDAVINQKNDAFLTMATGGWTSRLWTSIDEWSRSFGAIQYLNLFLENVDQVKWAEDSEKAQLLARRTKGEAYGLRGMFYYYLLRAHAGYSENGELLGVPRITEYLTVNSELNLPRASFQACVEQINSDLAKAEELLPLEYLDVSQVPADYQSITQDVGKYNNVVGAKFSQLFNGLIARAYRARTALLAASPAFQDGSNTVTWADAANAAAAVINYNGGIGGIAEDGVEYYSAAIADNIKGGVNPKEIVWRQNVGSENTQESSNFPPSLNGNGNMNPSQNLVDAFPMANGYPITDIPNSQYNEKSPYTGRDPRLAKYIIYNGSKAGVSNTLIYTGRNSGTDDGIDVKEQRSTRTGYYMRKRLRMDVNCAIGSTTTQPHYNPRIRYTEMYLTYAEAANEAWGPKGDNGNGYSAYDVIKAIRKRAGVGGGSDPYLEKCANSKDEMRKLIRNERRLELCFEGFRFWDLRRWKENLNEPVYGIDWGKDGNSFDKFVVEKRDYDDYMYYCPIPNSEILKFDNLVQNKGWK